MPSTKSAKRSINKIFISILVATVLALMLFPVQKHIYSSEASPAGPEIYDLVLLIDESGSMRKNDPTNMRIEAAKLFVDLINMLGKDSRVSIVGFGEETNIYIPLTDISENEDEIKSSINSIKSNQTLTDMKGALTDVRDMLNDREKKNKTAVIFLTDGKLDINDIPLPASQEKASKSGGDKPDTPVQDENLEIDKNFNINAQEKQESQAGQEGPAYISSVEPLEEEDDQGGPRDREEGERTEIEDWMEDYLEKYKAELVNLSYLYGDEGNQIYPIAFTDEANIELLEKIALGAFSSTWKAETASDIRDIFLEIFEHITSGFIAIREGGRCFPCP